MRSRSCNNPPASDGGLHCLVSGDSGRRDKIENETQICNTRGCPGELENMTYMKVLDIMRVKR